jgi:hypothetical protein
MANSSISAAAASELTAIIAFSALLIGVNLFVIIAFAESLLL